MKRNIRRIRWFHITSCVLLVLLFVYLSLFYLAKECHSEDSQTLVALTFDDGYECWTSTIMPILTHYDLPATAFINDPEIREDFTWTDVQELYNAGWEIGWHTAEHFSVTEVDRTEITNDFYKAKDLFSSHGLPPPVTFAYTKGKHDYDSMEVISSLYLAARTTQSGVNTSCYICENSARLLTSSINDGFLTLQGIVNKYSKQGVLIVFYGHIVGTDAALPITEINVEDFDRFAKFLHQEEENGTIDVVTFSEGVNRMQQRDSHSHWSIELDTPFNPWFKADVLPPEHYTTLYQMLMQHFLYPRFPQLVYQIDGKIFGKSDAGFYVIPVIVTFFIVSITVTIKKCKRKK